MPISCLIQSKDSTRQEGREGWKQGRKERRKEGSRRQKVVYLESRLKVHSLHFACIEVPFTQPKLREECCATLPEPPKSHSVSRHTMPGVWRFHKASLPFEPVATRIELLSLQKTGRKSEGGGQKFTLLYAHWEIIPSLWYIKMEEL